VRLAVTSFAVVKVEGAIAGEEGEAVGSNDFQEEHKLIISRGNVAEPRTNFFDFNGVFVSDVDSVNHRGTEHISSAGSDFSSEDVVALISFHRNKLRINVEFCPGFIGAGVGADVVWSDPNMKRFRSLRGEDRVPVDFLRLVEVSEYSLLRLLGVFGIFSFENLVVID
jgi:hypothetical protein